jgi:hypothetical protein
MKMTAGLVKRSLVTYGASTLRQSCTQAERFHREARAAFAVATR